jgi:hypothetical protein
MNEMLVAILISAAFLACGGKKASTAPANKDGAAMERKDNASGGATYGGKSADGPVKNAAHPSTPN